MDTKRRNKNVELDHLSTLETSEELTRIDDDIPDAHIFKVESIPTELTEVSQFL